MRRAGTTSYIYSTNFSKKTFAFEIQVMQDLTKISFNFLEVGKPSLLEAKQISHSRKAKHNSLLKTV